MKYEQNQILAGVHCDRRCNPFRRSGGAVNHFASTTSLLQASGLLANILPQFTTKTGITVNVVAQGTGKVLDTARRGGADLLLFHDPEAEQQFMDEGHGATRRQIAWNDFVIVGPLADPAQVRGGNDSVAALKSIASAQAPFVSRGDKSGTNAAELRLWKAPVKRLTRWVRKNGIATSAGAWAKPSMRPAL